MAKKPGLAGGPPYVDDVYRERALRQPLDDQINSWEEVAEHDGRKGWISPAEPQPSLYDEVLGILKKTNLRKWRRLDQKITPRPRIDAAAMFLRTELIKAVRYEFDDEACAAAEIFGVHHMDALASGMRWLRPLADFVWIELDHHAALRALKAEEPVNAKSARRLGYLIGRHSDDTMTARVVIVFDGLVYLPLIGVTIDPGCIHQGRDLDTMHTAPTEDGWWRRMLGVVPHTERAKQAARDLAKHLSIVQFAFAPRDEQGSLEFHKRLLTELEDSAGSPRRVAALLFLLTHRKLVAARLHEGQAAPGMSDELPYWRHSVIGIKLPREKAIGSLVRFARRSNREPVGRHDVEGHWCWSYKTDLGCAHDWHADDWDDAGTERRYRCAFCGGARWFRKKHERGDASRGWVIQRRVVTTKARLPLMGPAS